MRQAIKALDEGIASLQAIKKTKVHEYINGTKGDLLFISDHAKVRFLERSENLLLLGDTDKERLLSAGTNAYNLRERMLSRADQEEILKKDIKRYYKNKMRYIILNLTVVTVTHP